MTWIVVVREDAATVYEYEEGLRRSYRVGSGWLREGELPRALARRLEREAKREPPEHVVLLAVPSHLSAVRRELPIELALRIRYASNAIPQAADRAMLRAVLEPLVASAQSSAE